MSVSISTPTSRIVSAGAPREFTHRGLKITRKVLSADPLVSLSRWSFFRSRTNTRDDRGRPGRVRYSCRSRAEVLRRSGQKSSPVEKVPGVYRVCDSRSSPRDRLPTGRTTWSRPDGDMRGREQRRVPGLGSPRAKKGPGLLGRSPCRNSLPPITAYVPYPSFLDFIYTSPPSLPFNDLLARFPLRCRGLGSIGPLPRPALCRVGDPLRGAPYFDNSAVKCARSSS